jgi:hypothetical protein
MDKISYALIGDYYLPCLALSEPPDAATIGRYGMLHKEYLREHRPILYSQLLLSERLFPICREVDKAAAHRMEIIGNTEIAHEIILSELVYN